MQRDYLFCCHKPYGDSSCCPWKIKYTYYHSQQCYVIKDDPIFVHNHQLQYLYVNLATVSMYCCSIWTNMGEIQKCQESKSILETFKSSTMVCCSSKTWNQPFYSIAKQILYVSFASGQKIISLIKLHSQVLNSL